MSLLLQVPASRTRRSHTMGVNAIQKVLSAGSRIRVTSGEHFGREGRVEKVIGSPHEKRVVEARLEGVAGGVELFQHQIKVLHSPQGWKPGMKPVFHPYPPPEPVAVAVEEPKPKPETKPKGPSGAGKPRKRKGHHSPRQYLGDIPIPAAPGNSVGTRRKAH